MIRVAFASDDRSHVNLHFGGGQQLVVYRIRPGEAELVGIGEFITAQMTGANAERRPGEAPPPPPDATAPVEDKVAAKIAFLEGCAGVYAASIGASGIKRLLAAGIQPIIVDKGHEIIDLLNEVSLALVHGGLPWVTRAIGRTGAPAARSAVAPGANGATLHRLMASADDLI